MNSLNFNIDHGYLEGLLRGFKGGILKQSDYMNLIQCETLEGIGFANHVILIYIIFRHMMHEQFTLLGGGGASKMNFYNIQADLYTIKTRASIQE